MTNKLRRTAMQLPIRGLPDFYCIIGNESMTALNQLQRRFAFTNSAPSSNQHAHTINIHQYTVDRSSWRQLLLQEVSNAAG
ncbi:hypothetical protein D3C80_1606850 [compost metagenome]